MKRNLVQYLAIVLILTWIIGFFFFAISSLIHGLLLVGLVLLFFKMKRKKRVGHNHVSKKINPRNSLAGK
jgi:hypothetical protein